MKPGCFLKTLIFGTILLATTVYILMNKGKEWFVDPIKENILTSAFESFPNEIKMLKDSKEKLMLIEKIDSLKNKFKGDSTGITINFTKVDKFFQSLKDYSKDSLLSSQEFEFLKKMTDEMITTTKQDVIQIEKDNQAP